MRQLLYVLVALVFGIFLCGCNQQSNGATNPPPAPLGTVAIVDLDEVARRLGRDVQMVDSMKQHQSSLNDQLQKVQNSYAKQLQDKQKELGPEPTKEEATKLVLLQRQANLQFNQVRQQAQGNLTKHRLDLIAQFRNEAKPIAQEIAAEKGLGIVITKNDSVVFAHQAAVDITDELIRRMGVSNGTQDSESPARTADRNAGASER